MRFPRPTNGQIIVSGVNMGKNPNNHVENSRKGVRSSDVSEACMNVADAGLAFRQHRVFKAGTPHSEGANAAT